MSGRAGIVGIGAALPDQVITNADWEQRLDTTDEWIVRRTGIRERHWLRDDEELTDVAVAACERALADAGRTADDVDFVLCSTGTPDMRMPSMAVLIAQRLGIAGVGALDVNAACAGFVYGLDQALGMVEGGRARCVLLCAAEAISRIADHGDRSTAVLFGDGAGAVVVTNGQDEPGFGPFVLRADGQHIPLLYVPRDVGKVQMEGQGVYRHAVACMVEATRAALDQAGLRPEHLDAFVAHQANIRIIEAVGRELGLREDQVVLDVDRVANTSSASIPLALERAEREGRLRPNAIVGMAAFGSGFVWGAGIVRWKERAVVCL